MIVRLSPFFPYFLRNIYPMSLGASRAGGGGKGKRLVIRKIRLVLVGEKKGEREREKD